MNACVGEKRSELERHTHTHTHTHRDPIRWVYYNVNIPDCYWASDQWWANLK